MTFTASRSLLRFGQRVRYYRLKRHKSQEQLGIDLGQDQTYIHKVEHGKINISLRKVFQIAEILHIKAEELFK